MKGGSSVKHVLLSQQPTAQAYTYIVDTEHNIDSMKWPNFADQISNIFSTLSDISFAAFCSHILNSLVQIMAYILFGAMPSFKPMLEYCWMDLREYVSVKFN